MVTGILLSAGLSSRFGSPKALAKLGQETVIERLEKLLLSTETAELIIVLGHGAEQIKPVLFKHKKVKIVYNKDYKLGQTSSLKTALAHIALDANGILLLPVDYPLIKQETLQTLIGFFQKRNPLILIPSYHGDKGHPPIFDIRLKKEFLDLDNAVGINTVIHRHAAETCVLPVEDEGVIRSFNTPEEFEKLKMKLSGSV
ncbi:MAG: nucleotidyltransferase family protein [Candidatus Omnitrophica bacterium]|nr:nucleotidyltransferase family protein [Candidatus Omnitrophota bacterium]